MEHKIKDFLQNKSIVILGFGREGKSAYDFIRKHLPNTHLAIANQDPIEIEGETVISGEDYIERCADFDVIIKSPGVPIKNRLTDEQKEKITSLTDLFMRFCSNPIIGITGTKGKSTTTSLIYHILKNCNKDAVLVGNIGIPCFDVIDQLRPESIVVFELSAHQLEFVKAAPHISILLNLYEEHLDHYISPDAYFDAKKNIYRKQNPEDFLIYGDIFQHANTEEIAKLPQKHYNLYHDLHIDESKIHTTLVGKHNLYDIMTAIFACKLIGVDEDSAIKAVESFRALPHRLNYVGTFKDIKFYDDSIATAQEAVINAIEAVGDVDTVIIGGMERGLDYQPLADYLNQGIVKNIILLPNTADRIADLIPSQNTVKVADMAEAVQKSFELTAAGKSCLLSPAAASYGFYKNFEERGDDFCRLIREWPQNS